MIVKVLGLVDIIAAISIAAVHIPFLGPLKWLLVLILLIKGIPSLFAE